MKHIVTADWHLGIGRGHDEDIFQSTHRIAEVRQSHGIKSLVVAGDIWNAPRPAPNLQRLFLDCLNTIGCQDMIVMDGNHDKSVSVSNIEAFNSTFINQQGLKVITKPQIVKPNFLVVPFEIDEDFGLYVAEAVDEHKSKKPILVTHTDIPGAQLAAEREIQIGDVGTVTNLAGKVRFILSGHIHKHQSGKYGGVPWVYPGALSRASFSEEKEPKGFIVFDDETLEWEFITVDARKYVTVDYDVKTLGTLPKLPKADVMRLRLTVPSTLSKQFKRRVYEQKLAEKYGEDYKLEVNYEKKKVSKKAASSVKGLGFSKYESEWVEENVPKYKNEVKKKVQEYISLHEAERTKSPYAGLTITGLEIEDFQSIHKGSKEFAPDDCIGVLGQINGELTKSNGSGKSSLLEAIRFAFYGATRYSKNGLAIRDGAESAEVRVFMQDASGAEIVVERKLKASSSSAMVSTGDEILAKGKGVAEWIVASFGLSLDSFDSLVYMGTHRYGFISARASERMKSIQKPLPLDKYEKARRKVVTDVGQLNTELNRIEGKLEHFESSESDSQSIAELKAAMQKVETAVKSAQDKITKAEERVDFLDEEIEVKSDLQELEEELADEKALLKEMEKPEKPEAEAKREMQKASARTDQARKESLALSNELGALQAEKKTLAERQRHLQESRNDQCWICQSKLSKERKKALQDELHKYMKIVDEKMFANDKREQEVKREFNEAVEAESYFEDMVRSWQTYKEEAAKRKKHIKKLESDLIGFKEAVQTKKSLEKLYEEQKETRQKIKDLYKDLSARKEEFVYAEQSFKRRERESKEKAQLEKQRKKVSKEIDVLEYVRSGLHAKGIPQQICRSVIKEIDEAIPQIIDDFGFWQDISVRLEQLEDSIPITVFLGGKEREVEGISAGEKEVVNFIVTRATKRVLSNIIDVGFNFDLIDEALDNLDDANAARAVQYFKNTDAQTFCITHRAELKPLFSKTLIVANEQGVAEVL